MKFAAAQISSEKNNIIKNLNKHLRTIEVAALENIDLLFFPELSLTGYFPDSISDCNQDHISTSIIKLQQKCDELRISFGVGIPYDGNSKPVISMYFFTPESHYQIIDKLLIHPDEEPFFEVGKSKPVLNYNKKKIYMSICYESFHQNTIDHAIKSQVDLFVASVSKKLQNMTSWIAKVQSISTHSGFASLLVNNTGYTEHHIAGGQSSYVDKKGELAVSLSSKDEELLIVDLETQTTNRRLIK